MQMKSAQYQLKNYDSETERTLYSSSVGHETTVQAHQRIGRLTVLIITAALDHYAGTFSRRKRRFLKELIEEKVQVPEINN